MAWTDPGSSKPVALIGHMDTVHPVGSFGSNPFLIDGDTVLANQDGITNQRNNDGLPGAVRG